MTLKPLACALAVGLVAGLAAAPAAAQTSSAEACVDYHGFANAGWLAANPLPPGARSLSALDQLEQRTRHQQIALLDAAMQSPQGHVQTLLGDFWASGLAEAEVERDGAQPLAPLLERIGAVKRSRHVAPTIAALHQVGIPVAFQFGADVDLQDLGRHIGYFTQGGLGLHDPAYYTRDDAGTAALMAQYKAYVQKILALTGVRERDLEEQADLVIDLERRIAQASRPLAELRDPRSNYARTDTAGLGGRYPNLQLDEFLQAQGISDDRVSMANPGYFAALDRLVDELKPEQWRAYLQWRVGDAMAPYLARVWRDAHFDFRGRVLAGQDAPVPRQQQVLDAINHAAGPMLGHEYAARYVTPDAHARATEIAVQVRDALGAALQRDSRFGPQARAEAAAKLDRLKIEIGTPSRDLDFTVQPMGRGSFGGNMLIASTWRHREQMRRIGEANADRRWNVLPQQPAITYDPAQNRLIVTAAALQPPLFDPAGDAASQFGSYGALVGHELSHGFDSRGRMVDAGGNIRNWWGEPEMTAWQGLAARVGAQYGGFDVPALDGVKVNAGVTGNENIADIAGVQLAWDAYSTAQPDADRAAREGFFKGWAGLWPSHLSAEAATTRAAESLHAPGKWRTNGALMNLPAFGEAHNCRIGSAMRPEPSQRIELWPAGG